jgi:hypothetical protein
VTSIPRAWAFFKGIPMRKGVIYPSKWIVGRGNLIGVYDMIPSTIDLHVSTYFWPAICLN